MHPTAKGLLPCTMSLHPLQRISHAQHHCTHCKASPPTHDVTAHTAKDLLPCTVSLHPTAKGLPTKSMTMQPTAKGVRTYSVTAHAAKGLSPCTVWVRTSLQRVCLHSVSGCSLQRVSPRTQCHCAHCTHCKGSPHRQRGHAPHYKKPFPMHSITAPAAQGLSPCTVWACTPWQRVCPHSVSGCSLQRASPCTASLGLLHPLQKVSPQKARTCTPLQRVFLHTASLHPL